MGGDLRWSRLNVMQLVRRVRRAAPEPCRRPGPAGRQRTVGRWFDTSAFAAAGPFALGTASRNPVRGPSYRNLDLAIARRVTLPAANAVELRVECFNVTNTPPFGNPNGTFGSPAFGAITTAAIRESCSWW
jgi:hypothetical protein